MFREENGKAESFVVSQTRARPKTQRKVTAAPRFILAMNYIADFTPREAPSFFKVAYIFIFL